MKSAEEIKVRVLGIARWDHVLADQLRSVGINAFVSRQVQESPPMSRLMHRLREVSSLDIEHVIFPSSPTRYERIAWMLGTRVVYHWIGSDVLALRKLPLEQRRKRLAQFQKIASLCLADSPELAAELKDLGVETEVVRLLPLNLWGEISPLPKQFSVLSYWGMYPEFYRSNVIYALAKEFATVPFYIAGTDGKGQTAPPNVTFLGSVKDMDSVYRKCSVLIRMPLHDSVSVMVLEAMARGRYVIYSRPFPQTTHAEDFETARTALKDLLTRREINSEGVQYVRANFDPVSEATKVLQLYQRLLGQQ